MEGRHGAIFEREVEMLEAGARKDGLVVLRLVQSHNCVDGETSECVDVARRVEPVAVVVTRAPKSQEATRHEDV